MIVSLTYISLPQMMYALIASFMYGQIVRLVQQGGYTARGTLIISDQSETIARFIMEELGRGSLTYMVKGPTLVVIKSHLCGFGANRY